MAAEKNVGGHSCAAIAQQPPTKIVRARDSLTQDDAFAAELTFEANHTRVDHVGNDRCRKPFVASKFGHCGHEVAERQAGAACRVRFVSVHA
jgi:hypothetical protein